MNPMSDLSQKEQTHSPEKHELLTKLITENLTYVHEEEELLSGSLVVSSLFLQYEGSGNGSSLKYQINAIEVKLYSHT